MIMADVWKIVFLVLGTQIVMVSYWLLAAALFPKALMRTRQAYDGRAARSTLIGILATAPLLVGGVVLLQGGHPLVKLFGAVLLSTPVVLGLMGSAGLCDRIGAGLPAEGDQLQPWRRVLRGGAVLSFAFVLPVIGWFLVLPWTLLSGVGASLGAWRATWRAPSSVPEPLR